MSDRVQIYSRANQKLAEVIASPVRSWHATRTGRAIVELPHGALPDHALSVGTRWSIINPDVPPWVGVMTIPLISDGSIYRITLMSAEWVLEGRYTTWSTELTGTGGEIVQSLLDLANAQEPTGITAGTINVAGQSITRSYRNYSVSDAMRELASDLDNAWWISSGVTSGNLALLLNYSDRRGGILSERYIENHNLAVSSAGLEGDIANSITAVGMSGGEGEEPPTYTAVDEISRGRYGLIQDVVIAPDMEDESSLQGLAASHVSRRAHPRLVVQAVVTQPPYPRVADILSVWLNSRGLLDGRHTMRVQECSFDPRENLMAMTLREVT